jgi:hypothetical protein
MTRDDLVAPPARKARSMTVGKQKSIRQRQLLELLRDRLARDGFVLKLRDQSFYKKADFGALAVHLAFMNGQVEFDVTMDVAVRFNSVEDLVHPSSKKAMTFTMGCELGNLESGARQRWTVAEASDVARVSEAIYKKFEKVGRPYLERYSSIDAAYEVLQRDDRSGSLHSPLDDERAKRALAIAALRGRDEFEALLARKRPSLATSKNANLADFEAFVTAVREGFARPR